MGRRNRGDGGLYWDEGRQRWIGVVTVGYDTRGKPQRRKISARTKTEGNEKLRALLREVDLGVDLSKGGVTVEVVIESWLTHGLHGRSEATRAQNRHLAECHIVPLIGKTRFETCEHMTWTACWRLVGTSSAPRPCSCPSCGAPSDGPKLETSSGAMSRC